MDCDSLKKNEIVCRGSVMLGSGCRKCRKCLEEIAASKRLMQIAEPKKIGCVGHDCDKCQKEQNVSLRGKDWQQFSAYVLQHIEGYTVPQYGDKGSDIASEYSAEDCIKQVRKYAARFGTNSRPGQETLDLFKMAHYIQMAYEAIEAAKVQHGTTE